MSYVISCGNANIDMYYVVDELPQRDQEAIAEEYYEFFGGAGSNVAVALAKLGLKSCFLGCVGNDTLGINFIKDLEKHGVITKYIKIINNLGTGRVIILVRKDTGEKSMIAYRGANLVLNANLFPDEVFENCRHLHISSIRPEVALDFLKKAKRYGKTTSYDPGSAVKAGLNNFIEVFNYLDILFLNKYELFRLTKVTSLDEGLDKLLKLGVKAIVLKLGSEGSMYKDNNTEVKCEAFKVSKVVDTTGAGDAFNAGFLYGYLKKLEPKLSLILGNAVAALKIAKKGARASPYKTEVIDFLNKQNLENLSNLIR